MITIRNFEPPVLIFGFLTGTGRAIAGAVIGAKHRLMVVTVVGGVVGWVCTGVLTNDDSFAVGALFGAPAGAVVGALIGQLLRKRIAWLDFPLLR